MKIYYRAMWKRGERLHEEPLFMRIPAKRARAIFKSKIKADYPMMFELGGMFPKFVHHPDEVFVYERWVHVIRCNRSGAFTKYKLGLPKFWLDDQGSLLDSNAKVIMQAEVAS